MRLMLIAPHVEHLSHVKNFSGVWSYYLTREFRRMGVEVIDCDPIHNEDWPDAQKVDYYKNVSLHNVDHVLALGIRYWDRLPAECGYALMRKMRLKRNTQGAQRGLVAQLHDGATRSKACDVTFHIKIDNKIIVSNLCNDNEWVGWAADDMLLKPSQRPNVLSILIDHAQLEGGEPEDATQSILDQTLAFAADRKCWGQKWEAVEVKRIVDGGVVDASKEPHATRYKRQPIPFIEIAEMYRWAHVFMVTHPESVGLSVIESAMAGALPVVPQGYVSTPMLNLIRSLRHKGEVPWKDVLAMVSPRHSRTKALPNNWSAVAQRIVNYFERYGQ